MGTVWRRSFVTLPVLLKAGEFGHAGFAVQGRRSGALGATRLEHTARTNGFLRVGLPRLLMFGCSGLCDDVRAVERLGSSSEGRRRAAAGCDVLTADRTASGRSSGQTSAPAPVAHLRSTSGYAPPAPRRRDESGRRAGVSASNISSSPHLR
jgi:hypothetical protein